MSTTQTQTTAREPMPGSPVARSFIEALRKAESGGDVGPLVATFSEDAELLRLNGEPYQGLDEARAFWEEYVAQFGVIRSTFTHVTEGTNTVVLEWVSEGTLADERPLRYLGVSVLEVEGEKIRRLRTYYDSAAFTPFGTKNAEVRQEPPTAG